MTKFVVIALLFQVAFATWIDGEVDPGDIELADGEMIAPWVSLKSPKFHVVEGDILVREGEPDDYAAVPQKERLWPGGVVPIRMDPSLGAELGKHVND